MIPLAHLPFHGTQSKDLSNVKLMHNTVVCQILISKNICFLYRCLVMILTVFPPTPFVLY